MVVDRIGVLFALYTAADAAFVGGGAVGMSIGDSIPVSGRSMRDWIVENVRPLDRDKMLERARNYRA